MDALKAKRQRVIEAFLHERAISTYQEQLDLLNEEIALAELEVYDTRLEELDIEAALNYATSALSNAAMFWTQCSADQKQRFQRVLFPDGLIFDGESYRTATTVWHPVTCGMFLVRIQVWRPVRESNPCRRRERAVS